MSVSVACHAPAMFQADLTCGARLRPEVGRRLQRVLQCGASGDFLPPPEWLPLRALANVLTVLLVL